MTGDRVTALEARQEESQHLLARLAGQRAEYANLVNEVRHRTKLLEQAQADLANAQASQAGARSGGWLSRLDTPDPGSKPVGPSVPLVAAAGAVAGLALGVGLLVLLTPPLGDATRPAKPRLAVNGLGRPAATSVIYRRISVTTERGQDSSGNGHGRGDAPGHNRLSVNPEA
jgi:hypothetical protein